MKKLIVLFLSLSVLISACGEVKDSKNGKVDNKDSSKIESGDRSAKEKNRSQKVNLPDKNPIFQEPIYDNHELVDPDEEPITTNLHHIWTAKEPEITYNKSNNYAILSHSGSFFKFMRDGVTTPSTRLVDIRNGKSIISNSHIGVFTDIGGNGKIKYDCVTNELYTLTDTELSIENLESKEKKFINIIKKDKNTIISFFLDSCKRISIQQNQPIEKKLLERKLYDKITGKLLYEFKPEDLVREYKNNYLILSYINEFMISISLLNIDTKSIIWKKDICRLFIDRFPLTMDVWGDLLIIKYAYRGLFNSQNIDINGKTGITLNYIRLNPDSGEFIWENQIKVKEFRIKSAFMLDYRKMFTLDGMQHFNPEDGSLTEYTYEEKSNNNKKNVLENKEYTHYLSKYNAQYLRASKSRLYFIRNGDFYVIDRNTGVELFAFKQNLKERYDKLRICDQEFKNKIVFIDRKILVITYYGTYCFSETDLNKLTINNSFIYVDVPFFGFSLTPRTTKEIEDLDKLYNYAKDSILKNPPELVITNKSSEELQFELIPEEPFLKLELNKINLKPDESINVKVYINEFFENKMGEVKIKSHIFETSVILMTTNYEGADW